MSALALLSEPLGNLAPLLTSVELRGYAEGNFNSIVVNYTID